jgi:hypothetical protein
VLTESRGEPLCFTNVTAPEAQPRDSCYFTVVLMFLIQLGAGLGGIAVLSHGLVYVDDNVDSGSSAALIGKAGHRLRATGLYTDSSTFWGSVSLKRWSVPIMGGPHQKLIPPQFAESFSQSDPIHLGSTPTRPSNQIYFRKGKLHVPASVNSP